MAKRENILPYAPIGDLISNNTGKRVSKDAKKTATQILEELTEKIVKKANLLAEHSGRKTIQGKDILLSFNQLKGELK
jgi:histone H3/H4